MTRQEQGGSDDDLGPAPIGHWHRVELLPHVCETSNELAVLSRIEARAGDGNRCTLAERALRSETLLSRSRLYAALEALRARGVICRKQRGNGNPATTRIDWAAVAAIVRKRAESTNLPNFAVEALDELEAATDPAQQSHSGTAVSAQPSQNSAQPSQNRRAAVPKIDPTPLINPKEHNRTQRAQGNGFLEGVLDVDKITARNVWNVAQAFRTALLEAREANNGNWFLEACRNRWGPSTVAFLKSGDAWDWIESGTRYGGKSKLEAAWKEHGTGAA